MQLLGNGFRGDGSLLPWTWFVAAALQASPPMGLPQPHHPPGLDIKLLPPGQVFLTITNPLPDEVYELERAPGIAPVAAWRFHDRGAPGQTSFLVPIEPGESLFFKARPADDWDSDGVANGQDARPTDPAVGRLTVIIVSPEHGSIIP